MLRIIFLLSFLVPAVCYSQIFEDEYTFFIESDLLKDNSISKISTTYFNGDDAYMIINKELENGKYCLKELQFEKRFFKWRSYYSEHCDSLKNNYLYNAIMEVFIDTIVLESHLNQKLKKVYNTEGEVVSVVVNSWQPSSRLDTDTVLFFYNSKGLLDSIITYVDSHNGLYYYDDEPLEYKNIKRKMKYFTYRGNKMIAVRELFELKTGRIVDLGKLRIEYINNGIYFVDCEDNKVFIQIVFEYKA